MTVSKGVTETVGGFMVRIKRDGKTRQRWVGFTAAGSRDKALRQAKAAFAQLQAAAPARRTTEGLRTSRNRTGVVGVHRTEKRSRGDPGTVEPHWVAVWKDQGRVVQLSFAVGRYGEKMAKRLAQLARAQRLRNRRDVLARLDLLG